MELSKKIYGKI